MKTPALLLLSTLVALGHWLVLAPGPGTLTQILAQTAPSASASASPVWPAPTPAAATPIRVLQTRRIESPVTTPSVISLAVLQAVRTVPQQTAVRPRPPKAAAMPAPAKAPLLDTRASSAEVYAGAEEVTVAVAIAVAATEKETVADPNIAARGETVSPAGAEAPALVVAVPEPSNPPLAAQLVKHLQLPKPARLNYDITGQSRGLGYQASGVLDWQQDGNRYDARLVASVFFLGNRTLRSQGQVTADGLAPTRFADKSRSEQAAHFEADKGKITFSANTPDAPWQRGAQDRLSVFFQLAGMLAGQPERVTPGTRIPVYTASARSADTWAFLVDEIENLSLPAGNMPAIKLTRQTRLEHDQLVEVWFAPSLSYWPVRIKLTQRNGDFVDQQLVSVTEP